jgi:hypothetical protein
VIYFYNKTNMMHQFVKFILSRGSTLHVMDGHSIHHQLSKTVHTETGICRNRFCRLLAGRKEMGLVPASKQSEESVRHISDAVCTVLDSQ